MLGWIIWGMVRSRDEPCHLSNLQLAREEAGQLQRLENMVRASIDMDFPERLVDSKKKPSVEDKQFEEIIGTTLNLVGDHYHIAANYYEFFVIITNLSVNYENTNFLLNITNFNFPAMVKKTCIFVMHLFFFSFEKSNKLLVFDFV